MTVSRLDGSSSTSPGLDQNRFRGRVRKEFARAQKRILAGKGIFLGLAHKPQPGAARKSVDGEAQRRRIGRLAKGDLFNDASKIRPEFRLGVRNRGCGASVRGMEPSARRTSENQAACAAANPAEGTAEHFEWKSR